MTPERIAELKARAELTAFTVIGGERQMLEPKTVYGYIKADDLRDLLAALDEREQQIAAARATANEIEARMNAQRFVMHNFDVMVAFFGVAGLPHRWCDLLAALDSAPKAVGDE